MTGQNDSHEDGHNRSTWTALALYAAAGWAAAEVLLAVRERFGLPDALDNIVLGLLLAGFAAIGLLFATGRLAKRSPLLSIARILAVAVVVSSVALGVAAWLGTDVRTDGIPSVAVLPCDYEGIEDHAFLGPAAAQEIHAKLAKVAGLQIPVWRSVLKSVQVGEDQRRIAEILRVGHLASCTITEAGDRMELATTIIDPEKGSVLWSGRKTYASADLVHALGEISRGIADALSVRITADESDSLTRAPTSSPEAYEHYLRARQAQGVDDTIGQHDYDAAMTHFRAAVDLDPNFAESWAGMATVTYLYGLNAPGQAVAGALQKTYTEQAEGFARRALELDDCNAEALWMMPWDEGWSPPAGDRVFRADPVWADRYEYLLAEYQRLIECEPNNALMWRELANFYSSFAVAGVGTEYPAEEMRAAISKALALDPTNCSVQEYWIRAFRDPFWAPRSDDVLTLEETRQAIHSALLVNPECGNLYDILARISVEQGRFDEAISWLMRRHEVDSDVPDCTIAWLLAQLGFLNEAVSWAQANEAGLFRCPTRTDFECHESREAYFSERCKARRLDRAKQAIPSDYLTAADWLLVFKYRQAMYEAQTSDRLDLVRGWLDEGLRLLGTDDPVAILGKPPKRLISARLEGLELVPIFRDLGLDDAATRMLELCRRDPDDPEQIVFGMDRHPYVDAMHRSLVGRKAEAMAFLARAVRSPEPFPGMGTFVIPDRWNLMFDRALDPLREDPEYAPQLEQLIEEYDAWLAPAKERAARAIETGDWASLRTLVDETPDMLAASSGSDD